MQVEQVKPQGDTAAMFRRERVGVLVVDDEELTQWGFRLLLAGQPWAQRCIGALDPDTALKLAARFQPRIVLVHARVLDAWPGSFTRDLVRVAPEARVLLVTGADAVPASTLRAYGAAGFVSRKWPARHLLGVIRAASVGVDKLPRAESKSLLSARQQEILSLIADGATNTEIATRLYLSHHTVKQHTSALYRKLDVRNRTHAVQVARRRGILGI